MSEKVYEMYEDYYKAEAQLQELIEARDLLKESLKRAHPSKLADGYIMLMEANEKIKRCEAALKAEYDAHQKACLSREDYDEKMAELKEGVYGSLVYMKHCIPEHYERVKTAMFADNTPEEIEEFNKEFAHFEATRLEEFIVEKENNE